MLRRTFSPPKSTLMHDPGMTEECVDAMLSIALDDGQRFSSHQLRRLHRLGYVVTPRREDGARHHVLTMNGWGAVEFHARKILAEPPPRRDVHDDDEEDHEDSDPKLPRHLGARG